jgi:hypothetical protein
MRALLIALTLALALTTAPARAEALPVADLCTPDLARGGVPADFVVDACVDATSMTLRNDLAHPVLVRREGDVGSPVRVHERGSSAATVLRVLGGADELLMPGDVARWPLGPVTQSLVDSITTRLPELGSGGEKNVRPVVAVVRELLAAAQERATCIEDKNFLRAAACDVDAASRISRTLSLQLPRGQAAKLLPVVLDRSRWAAWAAPATSALSVPGPRSEVPPTRTLSQAPVPVPPPVVPAPAVVAPPVAAPPPVVVSRPPVAVPAVPAPPPVAAAVVPAPAPAPAPAPTVRPDWEAWWASVLQQLAAQQNSPSTSGSDGNGKGNGNGNGRGHR